eukprot:7348780-Pyramimonas_sp.AAC.1
MGVGHQGGGAETWRRGGGSWGPRQTLRASRPAPTLRPFSPTLLGSAASAPPRHGRAQGRSGA